LQNNTEWYNFVGRIERGMEMKRSQGSGRKEAVGMKRSQGSGGNEAVAKTVGKKRQEKGSI
jgi:hypothetical protein